MTGPVTIASIRAHGVRQLLVHCRGKRAGHWPCHHEGMLPVDRFGADEALRDIEGDAVAPPAGGGAPTCGRLQRAAGTADQRWMDKIA